MSRTRYPIRADFISPGSQFEAITKLDTKRLNAWPPFAAPPQKKFGPNSKLASRRRVGKLAAAFEILTFALVGCATVRQYSPDVSSAVIASMLKGDTQLSCETRCSGSYGLKRRELKALYDEARWRDLALLVIGIGYANDQSYFYLGRAAEMLSAPIAAESYFHQAKRKPKELTHCQVLFISNCDGFSFPQDIDERLLVIANGPKQATPSVTPVENVAGPPSAAAPTVPSKALLNPPEPASAQSDSIKLAHYVELVQAAVTAAFVYPEIQAGLRCTVFVRVSPGGFVKEAHVTKSSGQTLFDSKAELAVWRASPLPVPGEPLFAQMQEIHFEFAPGTNPSEAQIAESKSESPVTSNVTESPTHQKSIAKTNTRTSVGTAYQSREEIALERTMGGVYEVPVLVNGVLKINFIIDSGAAEVSISPDVALTLIRTKTVRDEDWLPGGDYSFADGSHAKSERFKLQRIRVGSKELRDVACSISNSVAAPMLLGQSALEKLGKYSVDYKKLVLQLQ